MLMQEKVRAFIVDNFLFGDDGGLTDDSSFLEEGILDSTGIMQLVAFLGEEFSVVIEDDELLPDNLDSIHKVCAFIQKKQPALLQAESEVKVPGAEKVDVVAAVTTV